MGSKISHRFTLYIFSIFSLFVLVFFSNIPNFQVASALNPTVSIIMPYPIQNGGITNIPSRSITVTFHYKGVDDNDVITSFRCSLDTRPYPCPLVDNDPDPNSPTVMVNSTTNTTRNKVGSVDLTNLQPRATEYTFSVISINDRRDRMPNATIEAVESVPATWKFTIASGKNQTIPLQDLKEAPILNKTIGANNTNVTNFNINDTQVPKPK